MVEFVSDMVQRNIFAAIKDATNKHRMEEYVGDMELPC